MRPTGPPRRPLTAAAVTLAGTGSRRAGAAGGSRVTEAGADGAVPCILAPGVLAARALAADGAAPWSSRKNATLSFIVSDWCSSVLAEAAFSSTSAEFCCVTSSIWVSALLIWSIPVACSWLAAALSATMSVRTVGDQVLDGLGGLRGPLRQAAHLGGHHRKAAAGISGACRLDRGVERQQVGLPGDLVDHPDDVGDLARGILDPRHGVHRLGHHLPAAVGD